MGFTDGINETIYSPIIYYNKIVTNFESTLLQNTNLDFSFQN